MSRGPTVREAILPGIFNLILFFLHPLLFSYDGCDIWENARVYYALKHKRM